jgi:hypothetical protein
MSSGDCRPTHSAVRRMHPLTIITFSWSSDCTSSSPFTPRSFCCGFDVSIGGCDIYWRRISNDGSYKCDGIPMDSLITAAARALGADETRSPVLPSVAYSMVFSAPMSPKALWQEDVGRWHARSTCALAPPRHRPRPSCRCRVREVGAARRISASTHRASRCCGPRRRRYRRAPVRLPFRQIQNLWTHH